jgi:hypothetical protein
LEVTQNFLDTAMAKSTAAATWRNVYKIKEMSGTAVINGWITNLFPYVYTDHKKTWHRTDQLLHERKAQGWSLGLHPDEFPNGVSAVPFVWKLPHGEHAMKMFAGFADPDDTSEPDTVKPVQGWAVAHHNELPSKS